MRKTRLSEADSLRIATRIIQTLEKSMHKNKVAASINSLCLKNKIPKKTFFKVLERSEALRGRYEIYKEFISEKKLAQREEINKANIELLIEKLKGKVVVEKKIFGKMKEGKIVPDRVEQTEKVIYPSDSLQIRLLEIINPDEYKHTENVDVTTGGKEITMPIINIEKPKK